MTWPMTENERWGAQHHRERAIELENERREMMKRLGPGDCMKHLEYVSLRLSQEINNAMMRGDDIGVEADRLRTHRHRTLGKQYGIASRMIAQLRGEIAALKAELSRERGNRFYIAQDLEYGVHYAYPEGTERVRTDYDAGPFPEESVDQIIDRDIQRSVEGRAKTMSVKATKIFRTITRGPWLDDPSTPVEDCTHGPSVVPVAKEESTES